MKLKTLFGVGIAGLLSFTACNDVYPELNAPQSDESRVETVIPTRSGDRSVVTKTNLDNIIAKMRGCTKTRSAYPQNYTVQTINGESGKPFVYVVNFENNGGFILISASKRYNPILAYSETGNFSMDNNMTELLDWKNTIISEIEENEALPMDSVRQYLVQWGEYEPTALPAANSPYGSLPREEFLELQAVVMDSVMAWSRKGYEVFGIEDCPYLDAEQKDYLKEVIIGGMYPPYMEYWNEFTRIVLKHEDRGSRKDNFIHSTWGQFGGYNECFPKLENGLRAAAGCGPVAAGQIMYYFKHPSSYNWNMMALTKGTKESSRLLYDIAEGADAKYKLNSQGKPVTSTRLVNVKKVFEGLGYTAQSREIEESEFLSVIVSNLDQNKPLYTRGSSDSDGHAWVISGYSLMDEETYYEVWTYMRYNMFSIFDGRMFSDRRTACSLYMNWGWDGKNNGYYFTPREYTKDRAYIYNITPNR